MMSLGSGCRWCCWVQVVFCHQPVKSLHVNQVTSGLICSLHILSDFSSLQWHHQRLSLWTAVIGPHWERPQCSPQGLVAVLMRSPLSVCGVFLFMRAEYQQHLQTSQIISQERSVSLFKVTVDYKLSILTNNRHLPSLQMNWLWAPRCIFVVGDLRCQRMTVSNCGAVHSPLRCWDL